MYIHEKAISVGEPQAGFRSSATYWSEEEMGLRETFGLGTGMGLGEMPSPPPTHPL